MGSFFAKFTITILLAALVAAAIVYLRTGDPLYGLREDINRGNWARFDEQIKEAGQKNGVDPRLLKAVVWRESRFGSHKIGTAGERGLMQVTEGAAADYVKANAVQNFDPKDLFKPSVNLEIGAWYLHRALEHYQGKDDPVPFALSEFNAGRTRVKRWGGGLENSTTGAKEMKEKSFDSTRAYVESIEQRYTYYKERWKLESPQQPPAR